MSICFGNIRKELAKHIDLEFQKGATKFFKEAVKILGVRSAQVHRIEGKIFKETKDFSKDELFSLCKMLLSSKYLEEGSIALGLVQRNLKKFDKNDFVVFEAWLKKYVSNWALCDDISTHILGYFIFQDPAIFEKNLMWATSKNRWVRRASAVSLIYPLKKGIMLQGAFQVADSLLLDSDDMVQKGYGWMLKIASEKHEHQVFDFVMKRKVTMPRTALRYAIEKMPKRMRGLSMRRS